MRRCCIHFQAAIAAAFAALLSSPALAQENYSDLAASGVFGSAVEWFEGTLLGSVATTMAVIAVATVGITMLTGRMDVRSSARVILGCFMIFGASAIANGLIAAMSASRHDSREDTVEPQVIAAPVPTVPASSVPAVSDPYAGAAVPQR